MSESTPSRGVSRRPWDGRRIVAREPRFSVTSVLGPDGDLQADRRETGYYERRLDGYHWRPVNASENR